MESINLNNGILAEELVSVALLEDGFNVARPVRMDPLTSSQSGMERSSIGYYRDASKQDSVGEISDKNITGTKQVIDDAAARFWAKRGLLDPSKSRISYGRKLK